MKRACKRCNKHQLFEVPNFNATQKKELLTSKVHSPLKTVKMLMESYKLSHADSKFIVLHINTNYGQCNRCNYKDLDSEYTDCPKCKALNFNWKID